MVKKLSRKLKIDNIPYKLTRWIGTTQSILLHTLFFLVSFSLYYFGIAFDQILLLLTTVVSLEAIYLALFIQMTVNRNTESLEEVEENIDEIQEDVEELSEDIEEIQEEEDEEQSRDQKARDALSKIESHLQLLIQEIEQIRTKNLNNEKTD